MMKDLDDKALARVRGGSSEDKLNLLLYAVIAKIDRKIEEQAPATK